MKIQTAGRMNHIEGSVIRQFAEAALKPGLITFANGNPAPATYPVEQMKQFFQEALESNEVGQLLMYGAVQGFPPLVDCLKERLAKKYGFDFETNDLYIVSGGTQAADVVSKIWLEKGDAVITEEPSYASMYNIFRAYEADLIGVPIDETGMDTDAVEEALKTNPKVKLIYTIPSFQNPTGFSAAAEKRKKLYDLACKYDVIIFEDDPYAELRFEGETVNPIKSYDIDGRVFYTSSLSKVIAPSFRLGYLVVKKEFGKLVNVCKQCTDVHSNTIGQYVAWGVMTKTDYEGHIKKAQEEYRRKSSLIVETLKKYMHPSCRLSHPTGGMFIMMFMPDTIDAVDFTWKGIDRGVVCVPGSGFAIDGNKPSHMVRMCYATATDEEIVKGAEIVGRLTCDMIEGKV
ncbi:PLP-dependent aminotransferase family protein [Anaerotignum faecicola]|nr:PLP-dependent aminotransferase family protein [Anaerotignum faecicola]